MQITIKTPFCLPGGGNSQNPAIYVFPTEGGESSRLFLLCEGSGKNAEIASLAARLLGESLHGYFTKLHPPGGKQVGQLYVNEALRHAERNLQKHLYKDPLAKGMGATFTLLHLNADGTATVAWSGNCRTYHVRKGQLLHRTDDHLTNVFKDGSTHSAPRRVTGEAPAWASVAVREPVSGDYFFMCSPGITQTLADRNIKYLLSQGNGSDATNKAIMDKVREIDSGGGELGAYLIQIAESPFAPPDGGKGEPQATSGSGGGISLGKIEPQRQTAASKGDPTGNIGKKGVLGVVGLLVLLLLCGALIIYKLVADSPDERFGKHMENARMFMADKRHENAIRELRAAMTLDISQPERKDSVAKVLRHTLENRYISEGDAMLDKGKLLPARDWYEQVLAVNPYNEKISNRIGNISVTLCNQKARLMQDADSLYSAGNFKAAKDAYLDALQLDRLDVGLEDLIGLCNEQLATAGRADSSLAELAGGQLAGSGETDPSGGGGGTAAQETTNPPTDSGSKVITGELKYQQYMEAAEAALAEKDYGLAKTNLENALMHKRSAELLEKIAFCDEKLKQAEYNGLIAKADRAFARSDFEEAQRFYKRAATHSGDTYAIDRAEECAEKIAAGILQYEQIMGTAQNHFESGDYDLAIVSFEKAASLSPKPDVVREKINECRRRIKALKLQDEEYSQNEVKKAQAHCNNFGYNQICYDYLKEAGVFGIMDKGILFQLGQHFRRLGDTAKARECYEAAAKQGSNAAQRRLDGLEGE